MAREVRYCTTEDGVRIAYAVAGTGPPLVWVPGWLSHLELDLEFPPFRERVDSLAEDFTLIRFDKRGTGVSQRGINDFSLGAHVLDAEAVVEALKLEKFALAGYSQGGPIAIAYTTRHPDAVSHLILMGALHLQRPVPGHPCGRSRSR
jgi:pimeloyl-ACP methyl ester carboxylesterase